MSTHRLFDFPDEWPVLGGADVEFANWITGRDSANSSMAGARALLSVIDGVSDETNASISGDSSYQQSSSFDPQDWSRKWMRESGACIYIDLSHGEGAIPEIRSAREFVIYWHAMLRTIMRAREAANRLLPAGQRLEVLANNSDGQGHSWGSHLNFCLPRRAFDHIIHEKLHYTLFLAGFQASSILFTGQGKVGSENDRPDVDFQISQRADFFESVSGWQTTHRRPMVNNRDEPHAFANRWARLHVIFYDSCLSPISNYLKFGVMQIVLAMMAQDAVDTELLLEDPLAAVGAWSHDLTFTHAAPLLRGGTVTAIELQLRILEQARTFVERGECNVPDAPHLIALWEDTLMKLKSGALEAVAPRLDWVRKLLIFRQVMKSRPDLRWQSPEIRHLDQLWSSLDPAQGLYWAMERAGAVEKLVSEEEIVRAMNEPPSTRAFARAQLLRRAAPGQIKHIDWETITINVNTRAGRATRTLLLSDPFFSQTQFERLTAGCDSLEEMFDALGASAPELPRKYTSGSMYVPANQS